MRLFTAVTVLAVSCGLLACSSSSSGSPSTGNAQITGTLGSPTPFAPADAIAYRGNTGASYRIELTDYAGACAAAKSAVTKGGASTVSILLPNVVAGTTYPIDAVHAESGTNVSFDTHNPDCTSGPPGGPATGGHVTITAANETSFSGTFELTFDVTTSKSTEKDTITGSFVAPICAGAFEAMGSAQHITCQ